MINIVVADDHRAVREGLKTFLSNEPDFNIIGEAGNGLETVDLVEKLQPDILILDLMMPGINGLEVARRLDRNCSHTGIVILSMHKDQAYVQESMHRGAKAYILKESIVEELVHAIREVVSGRCYLSLLLCSPSLNNSL